MGLTAVVGAVGFFTRLPIGATERGWEALTARPAATVVVAYPLGAALSLAVVAPVPPATAAVAFLGWLLALAGITHLDGVADAGDAAVVHGAVDRRRAVLGDSEVGVGAVAAVALVVAGLALAILGLAGRPAVEVVAVVVAAEVGAKLGLVLLASVGPPPFGDLGSQFGGAGTETAVAAVVLASPVALWSGLAAGGLLPAAAGGGAVASPTAAVAALLGGPLAALLVGWWGATRLDGINGDCLGATNEVGRVLGLHCGLVALSAVGPSSATTPLWLAGAAIGVVA